MEFLLRGILNHGEAGVLIAFEETAAINGEQGRASAGAIRAGEYRSDCVVLLDLHPHRE